MSSFRDPAGQLLTVGDRVLRVVTDPAAVLESPVIDRLMVEARLVQTRRLSTTEVAGLPAGLPRGHAVLEHARIAFPSYPQEWPPAMLAAAAELTLDLSEALLAEGLGLKDATPLNVLFDGHRPVFVDYLSIERREPLDPIWTPNAQFVRTFILPLLVAKQFGVSHRMVFEASREGIAPEQVYEMTGVLRRLLPPFFTLVTLPTWLTRRTASSAGDARIYRPRVARTPEQARYVLGFLFKRLRKLVRAVTPAAPQSHWSSYAEGEGGRTVEIDFKVGLVRDLIARYGSREVLDIGCNTGYLAASAARQGARVVAIDADPAVVGAAWRRAAAEQLPVLPLVVDITRPTPAVGWRNQEARDFLSRARGRFDTVLMFGVIHHMLVTERIPLEETFDLVVELLGAGGVAAIEYVPPADPFFQRLTRGRAALYEHLTIDHFRSAAARHFEVVQTHDVPSTARSVFLLRKGR